MKKLTALLALFLLLALLAQGACAAVKVEIWPRISRTIPQEKSILCGNLEPNTSISNYELRLSPIQNNRRSSLRDSFNSYFDKTWDTPLDSGYTRKAMYINIELWGQYDALYGGKYYEFPGSSSRSGSLNPLIPLSTFMPNGTQFKNLRVFHAQTEDNPFRVTEWDPIEPVLHLGAPEFDPDADTFEDGNSVDMSTLTTSAPNHQLRLSMVYQFSPFVIVWDELPTDGSGSPSALTPPDVPQTGDSASFAPWLLLLGGACALLALRRRSQRA